jgi:hypothetical protein
MQKALRIHDLRQEAQELARSIGFGLTDPARDLFRLVPVQEYGDLKKIAEFLGVPRDTVYQWNLREGHSGALERASKAREAGKKFRRDLAKQQVAEIHRQTEEMVMLAWRAGASAPACTGLGSRNGTDYISRLRAKYGVEKVPYRKEGTIKTRRQRALIHAS